jgi:hypothetical protein
MVSLISVYQQRARDMGYCALTLTLSIINYYYEVINFGVYRQGLVQMCLAFSRGLNIKQNWILDLCLYLY